MVQEPAPDQPRIVLGQGRTFVASPPMATALIVEFGTAHAECLPMPCRALAEAGHEVRLLVHPDLVPRVRHLAPAEALPIGGSRLLEAWRVQAALTAAVRRYAPSVVIFNTASGIYFRHAVLLGCRGVPMVATIHDLGRLRRSSVQRFLARRLAGAVVLAERLVAPTRDLTGGPVVAAYPRVPVPPRRGHPPGEVWLASVGQVETSRRSYGPLLEAVRRGLPTNVRLFILGRPVGPEGEVVLAALRAADPTGERIQATGTFVSDEDLHQTLAACDGILPLIEGHDRYLDRAVSGSFGLAYSHGLPVVGSAPIGTPEIDDFAVLPQPGEDFAGLLTRLAADPTALEAARAALAADPRFGHDHAAAAWRTITGR